MDSICSTHRVLYMYDIFVHRMKCEDSPRPTEILNSFPGKLVIVADIVGTLWACAF